MCIDGWNVSVEGIFHRRRLPHYEPDVPLFVTFRTWMFDLQPACRDLVLKHCLYEHHRRRVLLHAVVVMPDHVHLLFSCLNEPNGEPVRLHRVMDSIKGTSAHSINKFLKRRGPVRQDEYFDRALRSYDKLEEKMEYVRQNPVRRKLVTRPEEYKWLWEAPRIG